ncbi:ArsR/SmtB family transcription factor [Polycladidibacter stylochi]|uniref:ArsR/SmtB family transcription factor n=1 Tax=Polycladidibacter stylochi TaxID=1807766 RepID=UPI0009E72B1C|nr:metalloregulator ArsR/SmtB family transcription factor [Pseudovibrio stylochi]
MVTKSEQPAQQAKQQYSFDADRQANLALATKAKALSHPVRLEILRILAACDTACCADLVSNVPLAQSTISQHLKVLCEAGFITMESKGRMTCISLCPLAAEDTLKSLRVFFGDLFDERTEAPCVPLTLER